jgi:hypothetical protein
MILPLAVGAGILGFLYVRTRGKRAAGPVVESWDSAVNRMTGGSVGGVVVGERATPSSQTAEDRAAATSAINVQRDSVRESMPVIASSPTASRGFPADVQASYQFYVGQLYLKSWGRTEPKTIVDWYNTIYLPAKAI